jgi:tyrosine-protein phosphatase YwqE
MKAKYKVLKTQNASGHFVNDSEGIVMEWDTYEQAKAVAELFQANTIHGYTYIIVHPNGSLDVFENK